MRNKPGHEKDNGEQPFFFIILESINEWDKNREATQEDIAVSWFCKWHVKGKLSSQAIQLKLTKYSDIKMDVRLEVIR